MDMELDHVLLMEDASWEARAKAWRQKFRLAAFMAVGLLVAVIVMGALLTVTEEELHPKPATPKPTARPETWDALEKEMRSSMDTSVKPCDNFYQFACGKFLESAVIPADRVSVGNFQKVAEANNAVLDKILSEDWPLLGPYQASCLNLNAINALGWQPIAPLLQAVDGVTTAAEALTLAGRIRRAGAVAIVDWEVTEDFVDPSTYALLIGGGGASLPSFLYNISQVAVPYTEHMAYMFGLVGMDNTTASAAAAAAFAVEKTIAEVPSSPDIDTPQEAHNVRTIQQLSSDAPDLYLPQYFAAAGISQSQLSAIVDVDPAAFRALNSAVSGLDVAALRAYLKWRIVHSFSGFLSEPFVEGSFDFFGRFLRGQAEMQPRESFCRAAASNAYGDLLGRLFVSRAFSEQASSEAETILEGVKTAFKENLDRVPWMSANAKDLSREKVNLMLNLVGYPSTWDDYDGDFAASNTFFANHAVAANRSYSQNVATIGKAVDRQRWYMHPSTVNAYYHPLLNEMVFPAGILQPRFFDLSYPRAVNYGGIGTVMGHELTHGFDNSGSEYDAHGRLRRWWDNSTRTAFQAHAVCLVNQYDTQISYGYQRTSSGAEQRVPVGLVNGKQCEGENIADNGGVKMAFHAFTSRQLDEGPEPQLMKEYDNMQLFWLSYAQLWCSKRTANYALLLLQQDVHSPPMARVNTPLQNTRLFSDAWHCPSGSFMNPAESDRCGVW